MRAQPKPYRGLAMEGPVASWYTRNTRNDTRRFLELAHRVGELLPAGGRVLEVAPGPGFLAVELARRGYRVTAVDVSRSFVRIAREHARSAGVEVEVLLGDAAHLPLPDAAFDLVVCSAAFKNFTDPRGALDEMHRVLRPGGVACVFDLRKDAPVEEIDGEVAKMGLSAVNALLTRLTFRHLLLRSAYTRQQLEQLAAASRFGGGELRPAGIGFELRLTRG